ncbi:MAG: DUF4364 family protein [Ruminococcus sp.]|nr:DUF4364 family protein [Ruminococcus sp.]
MQDENIYKMAEFADTEIRDIPAINILICYLLSKVKVTVEADELYDIAVGSRIVNYFAYQESFDYLVKNGLMEIVPEGSAQNCVLLEKGRECAKELKQYAPKSFRDNILAEAEKYFSRIKKGKGVRVEFTPLENGCYVRVRCIDNKYDLMDLKLYAPDMHYAEIISERVLDDPAGFYGKIIGLAVREGADDSN